MPAPVAPITLTAAGLSPDRADRATFVARSIARDEFIKNTQIPQLQTAITNVYNNSLEAYNSGVSATADAASSAINASQAASAATAIQWVSGTTYTVGDARWSPITKISYRRTIAGAGTTDPSADTTNWAAIIMPAAAGGTGGAALGGFRNRVLNGDFSIDQEFVGAAVTVTAGAALRYVIDGWYAFCTGSNVTYQTVTTANRKRAQFTGLAANTGVGFATRIESNNSADMAAAFATLRMLLSSSSITTANWGLYYANTVDAFGTIATPTRTAIQTGSFTITTTETAYSAITTAALAAGATTGLELVITVGALLGTQTLTIGDVQVEKGSIASPVFEVIAKPVQQLRCERHVRVVAATMGTAVSATSAVWSINHVGMFAAPSITATSVLTVTDEIAANYTQASANAAITENTANGGRYSGTFAGMTSGRFANLLTIAGAGRLILAARL